MNVTDRSHRGLQFALVFNILVFIIYGIRMILGSRPWYTWFILLSLAVNVATFTTIVRSRQPNS